MVLLEHCVSSCDTFRIGSLGPDLILFLVSFDAYPTDYTLFQLYLKNVYHSEWGPDNEEG